MTPAPAPDATLPARPGAWRHLVVLLAALAVAGVVGWAGAERATARGPLELPDVRQEAARAVTDARLQVELAAARRDVAALRETLAAASAEREALEAAVADATRREAEALREADRLRRAREEAARDAPRPERARRPGASAPAPASPPATVPLDLDGVYAPKEPRRR